MLQAPWGQQGGVKVREVVEGSVEPAVRNTLLVRPNIMGVAVSFGVHSHPACGASPQPGKLARRNSARSAAELT